MKKYYNGNLDNHDARRPKIGVHCRPKKAKAATVYKLTNIFTNGGKYDTYELKNPKTGKRILRRKIEIVRKSRPVPFTKAEVWKMILEQDSKPAEAFRKMIQTVEDNPDDLETWRKLIRDAICRNHTAKMEDMISISTSCKISCGDNKMRDDPDFICFYCFSDNQQDMQKGTRERLIRNTYLFAFHDIPAEAFPKINALWFRLESFGDLMNYQQFENYLKLVRANPRVTFAEWTKKPWIMNHVLKTERKPENLIIILSSPRLNDPITIEQARANWWFVDKIFTVFTDDYITDNSVEINCGANYCLGCLRCYEHNEVHELKERRK